MNGFYSQQFISRKFNQVSQKFEAKIKCRKSAQVEKIVNQNKIKKEIHKMVYEMKQNFQIILIVKNLLK